MCTPPHTLNGNRLRATVSPYPGEQTQSGGSLAPLPPEGTHRSWGGSWGCSHTEQRHPCYRGPVCVTTVPERSYLMDR